MNSPECSHIENQCTWKRVWGRSFSLQCQGCDRSAVQYCILIFHVHRLCAGLCPQPGWHDQRAESRVSLGGACGHVISLWYLPYFGNQECWELGCLLPSHCYSPDWPEDRTDRTVPQIIPPMAQLWAFPTRGFLVFLSCLSLPPLLLGSREVSVRLRSSSPSAASYSWVSYETSLNQNFLNHKLRLIVTSLGVVRNGCPCKAFSTVPSTFAGRVGGCLLPFVLSPFHWVLLSLLFLVFVKITLACVWSPLVGAGIGLDWH